MGVCSTHFGKYSSRRRHEEDTGITGVEIVLGLYLIQPVLLDVPALEKVTLIPDQPCWLFKNRVPTFCVFTDPAQEAEAHRFGGLFSKFHGASHQASWRKDHLAIPYLFCNCLLLLRELLIFIGNTYLEGCDPEQRGMLSYHYHIWEYTASSCKAL